MKKFNMNSLLAIFAGVFIIMGIWGNCFTRLKWAAIDMLAGLKHGYIYSVFDFKAAVDSISEKELSYHDTLMDLDSVKNNVIGTRVIQKDDTTIVKSSSGSLIEPVTRIDNSEIDKVVLRLMELKTVAEENGAQFLYCAAPRKECYEETPSNIENYSRDNFERFISAMDKAEIPTLDLSKTFADEGIADKDIFYETDHHWKARPGFIAAKAICEKLSSLYGFAVNEQATDLNNYSITKYENLFLGSKGKKVGTFFTWKGRDDFELITPNFETDMVEEQPFKGSKREGTFEETALFLNNLEKDYYHKNPYATYSGGDFRLQIIKNKQNTDGKKILIVRDSFACAVTPFLALQTSELHICDMRDFEYFVGEKLNLKQYIQQVNPDYVLVLYHSVSNINGSAGKYDFS